MRIQAVNIIIVLDHTYIGTGYDCMYIIVLPYRAVEHLGGKNLVMNLVNHGNSDVRMQALLSIQKMMVQNWYVGN